MNSKINLPKDVAGYSTDMFWVGVQVRALFEKTKNKIKNLISK